MMRVTRARSVWLPLLAATRAGKAMPYWRLRKKPRRRLKSFSRCNIGLLTTVQG
jgi:hypothetical protein